MASWHRLRNFDSFDLFKRSWERTYRRDNETFFDEFVRRKEGKTGGFDREESSLAEKDGAVYMGVALFDIWRDAKRRGSFLRPGYKLQISLPSPANARLLVYPACRGCLRFFSRPLPLLTRPIQFRLACSVPVRIPRLADDETFLPSFLLAPSTDGNCRKFHFRKFLLRIERAGKYRLIRRWSTIRRWKIRFQ